MPRVIIDPKGPVEEISEPTPDFTVGEVKARKTKGPYCWDRAQCCFSKRKYFIIIHRTHNLQQEGIYGTEKLYERDETLERKGR